jgi:D-serine deaminase-like pyridoxal phosphate-dependent protein
MNSRRSFLAAAAAAPAVLKSSTPRGHSYAEIERMIARGDVRGKLSRADLPTPALVLELEAFEDNVSRMASYLKTQQRAFRPHAKTHKCPEIAKALIRAGATGACAAKISEAEALAQGGVTGLLITSSMIGRHRIERAIRLARSRPETIFCADSVQNVEDLNAAAVAARLRLNVAVDLLVGRRTGIAPGQPALALAQRIASLSNLRFGGIQAYAGHASHTKGFENRKRVSEESMGPAVETRRLIEKSGIECSLVTGGSTGTYNIDSHLDGVTELQPGSFIFMDTDYNRIGGRDTDVYEDFRNALFVITTVISKPSDATAIVDGGFKAFATDRPFTPVLRGATGVPYSWAGDEHGSLNLAGASSPVQLGDRLEFVVPHCDPTVNLYDYIFAVRGESVESVWRIAARGKSQ